VLLADWCRSASPPASSAKVAIAGMTSRVLGRTWQNLADCKVAEAFGGYYSA